MESCSEYGRRPYEAGSIGSNLLKPIGSVGAVYICDAQNHGRKAAFPDCAGEKILLFAREPGRRENRGGSGGGSVNAASIALAVNTSTTCVNEFKQRGVKQ
jgi:hypothetical protein